MINNPKYVLRRSANYQYYWNLNSVNGEVLLTSETYLSRQSAVDGIASSKRNTAESNFDRRTSIKNEPYFVQIASGNYQVLGTSEMYSSTQAMNNGIAAVKRDAPYAQTEDLT
jgi:uncharacterized protein